MTEIKVEGLKELDALLKSLPEKVAKKILRTAVHDAARFFAKEGQRRVSPQEGVLQKGILAKRKQNSSPLEATAQAGASTFYALMLEKGHKLVASPGYIPSLKRHRTKKKGKFETAKRRIMSKVIGSVRPRPFMRPAYDEGKDEAVRLVASHIARRIFAEAKKGGN